MYNTLELNLTFSPDDVHFATAADLIDCQEDKLYDDVIDGAFRDACVNVSSEHALVHIAREGRKFFRVTQPSMKEDVRRIGTFR
jgi:hypothetical protein